MQIMVLLTTWCLHHLRFTHPLGWERRSNSARLRPNDPVDLRNAAAILLLVDWWDPVVDAELDEWLLPMFRCSDEDEVFIKFLHLSLKKHGIHFCVRFYGSRVPQKMHSLGRLRSSIYYVLLALLSS
jgi:hypothetical protein